MNRDYYGGIRFSTILIIIIIATSKSQHDKRIKEAWANAYNNTEKAHEENTTPID